MIHRHLIANFKMNLLDSEIHTYLSRLDQSNVLKGGLNEHLHVGIAPSTPYLLSCKKYLSTRSTPLDLYAQNIAMATEGAHTGEVSARQVRDCGAQGSIIGHSERRSRYHENSKILIEKMRILKEMNMRAIYCLGEDTSDLSDQALENVLGEQVKSLIDFPFNHLIVAYEPKWAIGTGRDAQPQHIHKAASYIHRHLYMLYGPDQAAKIPLLYGGSVNAQNFSAILGVKNIHGALVGSASLDLDHFIALIEIFINANLSK